MKTVQYGQGGTGAPLIAVLHTRYHEMTRPSRGLIKMIDRGVREYDGGERLATHAARLQQLWRLSVYLAIVTPAKYARLL